MTADALVPCIIAGGAGTRLWPVSRATMPKPFIRLGDGQSLLQKTVARLLLFCKQDVLVGVVNRELRYRMQDDYQALGRSGCHLDLILEPFGRNTAAAVLSCALRVKDQWGSTAKILVSPADQVIGDVAALGRAVAQASLMADQGCLVTLGIAPTHAETGYGYIEAGAQISGDACAVTRFVEKPAQLDAEAFLKSGRFLWNSGLFCMNVQDVLDDAAHHAPELLESVVACWHQSRRYEGDDCTWTELDAATFDGVPDVSFDKAVLEHSRRLAVVRCAPQWKDVGSWQAMSELTPADDDGNRLVGETILRDVHDCYVDSPNRLTAMIGVDHLAVIDTPDALLITDKSRSQEVRFIAKQLGEAGHPAFLNHRTVHRPWGRYTVLSEAENYKIKRILVKPGASLSLQSHFHRSEHWVVVSGTAKVSNGKDSFLLRTNESTFIRVGDKHRLSNPGRVDLVIVEVQSGQYLEEDDIVRYDDDYGRVNDA